jgi:outer membrane protein OmpA-like peptidoglycan-associated protein
MLAILPSILLRGRISMKRTLLMASIAFIPTLAFAQSAVLPNRPVIVAQNDKATEQKPDAKKQPAKPQQPKRHPAVPQPQHRQVRPQPAKPQTAQPSPAKPQAQQPKRPAAQPPAAPRHAQPSAPQQPKPPAVQPPQQPKAPAPTVQPARPAPQRNLAQPPAATPDARKPAATQQDRREQRQDNRQDRRDDKQDSRQERHDDKQDARQDRRDNRQDAHQERREDRRLDALRGERKETKEGNRTVIRERDRTIIKQGNQTIIRHDDDKRFQRAGANERTVRRGNNTERVIQRPNGVRIVTTVDSNGRVIRRSRFVNGREYVLFTNRPSSGFNFIINVPPPIIHIPRERYIVEYRDAPPTLVYDTLIAPPVMDLDRAYSLDEVRYNYDVRARMPRIDIDSITFDTGSWDIAPDQADKLAPIAEAMKRAIAKNPNEVYMIEGHTDAVGSEDDNLLLSDHRAQAVTEVLTEDFGVPPENMIPQGYGEQNLKVPTQGPDERNRYVSVRRVTPLLAQQQ